MGPLITRREPEKIKTEGPVALLHLTFLPEKKNLEAAAVSWISSLSTTRKDAGETPLKKVKS